MSGTRFSYWLGHRVATLRRQSKKSNKTQRWTMINIYLSLPWHQICLTWTHLPILGVGVASCHFTWWPSGYLTVNFTAKAGKDPQVDIVAMQHLLDACCSPPCFDLFKRPDQCTPGKGLKPQTRCSAVQSCSASRHAAQQEKEWQKSLRGATASCAKSWCIRHQALRSPYMLSAGKCCILLRTLSQTMSMCPWVWFS